MDEIKRDGFLFYRSYYEAIKNLPESDRLSAYEAIFEYALNGTEPELVGTPAAIFILVKPTLDTSRRKAANGKAGGKSRITVQADHKQDGSKQQANEKQSVSKQEAKEKQSISNPQAIKDKGLKIKDKRQEIKDKGLEIKENIYSPTTPEELVKIKYAEYVHMTEVEHKKLIEQYGEEKTARMIEALDNYKGSKGKQYKSDYRAILSWVVDKVEKEQPREINPSVIHTSSNPKDFERSTGFKNSF